MPPAICIPRIECIVSTVVAPYLVIVWAHAGCGAACTCWPGLADGESWGLAIRYVPLVLLVLAADGFGMLKLVCSIDDPVPTVAIGTMTVPCRLAGWDGARDCTVFMLCMYSILSFA